MNDEKYDEMYHELARGLFTLDDIDNFCLLHLEKMSTRVYSEEVSNAVIDIKNRLNTDASIW